MQKITVIFSLVILILLGACKKNEMSVPYSNVLSSQGLLKINYACPYALNPSVQLKINGVRVSNAIIYATPFPGGGYNTQGNSYPEYLVVPQGNDTISISIPKSGTNIDSVLLYTTIVNLPDNSFYTAHITDTLVNNSVNNTTTVLLKNDVPKIDSGFSVYKFVNLIPNVSATNGAVDLYVNGILLVPNIPYKGESAYFKLASGTNMPGGSSTPSWTIRPAGSAPTSTALATYANASTLTPNQRVLTIFSRGYIGVTGTRAPAISFTYDR